MRFLLLLMLSLAPSALAAAEIEGRVVDGGEPIAGIRVAAYASLDFSAEPLAVSEPSSEEGLYRLSLPAGTYALAGWNQARSAFAVCGRNPVNLADAEGPVWVGLQLVPYEAAAVVTYDDAYSAAIEGQVLSGGVPVNGAYVYLYLDVAEDLKGQGYRISLPTGPDGVFRFDGLPESNYYLAARQRQDGQRVGPVREGDLFGIYPGNPLTARAGEVRQVKLHLVAKLQEAATSETFGRATGPVLRGVVLDKQGQGVADVHVFAYTDRVIGHQRPAAISTPTGPDGRFIVNLPAAGTYYVGARQAYGDSPAPGELFGMYDVTADHGLTVEDGQSLDNIEIVVETIELF